MEAEAGGRSLTEDEIKSFVSLMLVAGGETTDKAIANLWWNLRRVPGALAEVTADPAVLARRSRSPTTPEPPRAAGAASTGAVG